MYVESVPNRNSPPAVLLRETYRHDGKVKKRTLLNLSDWPRERVEGLRALLKGGVVMPPGSEPLQGHRQRHVRRQRRRHNELRDHQSAAQPADEGRSCRWL